MRSRLFVALLIILNVGQSHADTRSQIEATLLAPAMQLLNSPKSRGRETVPLSISYKILRDLPGREAARVILENKNQGPHVVLQIRESALNDPLSYSRQIFLLWELVRTGAWSEGTDRAPLTPKQKMAWAELSGTPMSAWEILSNAAHGSLVASERLLHLEIALMKRTDLRSEMMNLYAKALGIALGQSPTSAKAMIESHWLSDASRLERDTLPQLEAQAREESRQRQRRFEQERKEDSRLKALESQALKLNDLLLRNDRRGVRKMIEAYLPWTLMEASEMKSWQIWLDAIENPDPKNQVVAFRGTDQKTDFIQRLKMPDGSERVAFMSTVLTQNQGNYTRRLRSLTTRRWMNGDFFARMGRGEATPFVSISQQMANHAINPVASSFLSFSTDPGIAAHFVGDRGGFLAVKMDARRLIPNLQSPMPMEAEYLAPLVIFPDEVIRFIESDVYQTNRESFNELVDDVRRMNLNFQPTEPQEAQWRRFVKLGLDFLVPTLTAAGGLQCRTVFVN